MGFGSIMKKILAFLSPKEKEPTPREIAKNHWEPLALKKEIALEEADKKSAPAIVSPKPPTPAPAAKPQKVPEKPAGTLGKSPGKIESAYDYFKNNRKAAAALVATIITILFYKQVIPLYVIVIFIALASVSKIVQDYIPFVIGFDIVLFVTVLAGEAYGWRAALVVGPISSIIGSSLRRISSQQFDTIVFPAIGYGLIAAAIPYIPPLGIFWIGIVCTVIYVIIMNIVFAYFRPDIFNHITFTATSLLFNYWLFKNFAEPVYSLIV